MFFCILLVMGANFIIWDGMMVVRDSLVFSFTPKHFSVCPFSDSVSRRHHPHQEAEQRHDHIQSLGVRVG